ncbi:MAG: hypothetical protein DDT26_00130 [Dehalococcoidia bacterium]|nr:hypothetical protein [Chloroflexota bacterium]
MEINETYWVTSVEAAKRAAVTDRTVKAWAHKGYVPRNEKGQLDLLSALEHRITTLNAEIATLRRRKVANGSLEDLKLAKLAAEVRLLEAKADSEEFVRDERAQSLVERDSVEREYAEFLVKARARLLNIPTRLALELAQLSDPSFIERRLRDTVYEALIELANDDASTQNSQELEPTADADD